MSTPPSRKEKSSLFVLAIALPFPVLFLLAGAGSAASPRAASLPLLVAALFLAALSSLSLALAIRLRQSREQYVSGLLNIPESELTLGGRKAIARWYEVYGYDDAMVQEAAVQAGAKRDLWYWNSILKTWNAKGLRTVHDVRSPVADAGASRNIRVDREAPSGNDFLGNSSLSASLNRLKKRSNT